MTLLNIFHSGGLWVFPLAAYGAAIYLLLLSFKQAKSDTWRYENSNTPNAKYTESKVKVPFYKQWSFVWACILFACATYMLFALASDYKGV